MTEVTFEKTTISDATGYMISNEEAGIVYSARVDASADGIRAFHASYAVGTHFDDVPWEEVDGRHPAHWVHSMLSGQPSVSLLDILHIPYADRQRIAAGLFEDTRQFGSNLDGVSHEALQAMARAPEKKLSTYAFLAEAGDRGLYRRQAAASYPVFADIFNANLTMKLAIDRMQPLAEPLGKLLGQIAGAPVGKALLKRFASAPAIPEGVRLSPVLRFASRIQPDWFPKTDEEWTCFYHVSSALFEGLAVPEQAITDLIKGSGGKWDDLVRRSLEKAFPEDDHACRSDPFPYFMAAVADVRDMIGVCTDMVVIPLLAHAQDSETVFLNADIRSRCEAWAWEMLCEGRNLPDLLDLSRRFHQERTAMLEHSRSFRDGQIKAQIGENAWPGLTDSIVAPNGLLLVPLTTPAQLTAEGRELHHCVGGYSTKAKECRCHIVSVRAVGANGSIKSLSTCEFDGITSASPKLKVIQHKAVNNGIPTAAAADAMAWYKTGIESGRIPVKWDLIRAFLSSDVAIASDQVERICGYDWKDRDALDMSVRPWGAFVTKAYRTQGLDDLMDSKKAADIIKFMTPDFVSADRQAHPQLV